jgi:hypothetical protein
MKNIINKILVILPVAALLFSGCKKDKDNYTVQTKPVITELSPAQGVIGSSVTIKGQNLKNVNRVRFGKEDAAAFNRSANTDTSITVQVPAGVFPGDLLVQVYVENGGSTETSFKVYPQPSITLSSPTTGFPGDDVTITGENLDIITSVKFGTVIATFTATQTTITTKVPDNATGGNQQISISGPGGTATIPFTVNLAPQITSFNPTSGQAGDVITVTGKRFTGTTAVKIGSTNATFTVVSATELTFTIPAGSVTGPVSITTPNGTGISTSAFTVLVAGLAFPIYNDAITSNWNGWLGGGWGGTKDLANTSPVKTGSFSARIDYLNGQWGVPLQLGGAAISLAPYTTLKISIYGGANSNGKSVNIGFNEADGKTITVVEGQWTDFTIPLSEISSVTNLTHLYLKNFNAAGGDFTIYVDDMGLN